jgi:hypothetical protein
MVMDEQLRKLIAGAIEGLDTHMQGLSSGRLSVNDWQVGVAQDLLVYHYAAYMAGSGSREISEEARQRLNALIGQQVDRLNAFADVLEGGEPSEADAARLRMYANAVRASYWMGAAGDVDLPVYPGACPDCWSRCRCSLSVESDGVHWNCIADDRSCSACVRRGEEWRPYRG